MVVIMLKLLVCLLPLLSSCTFGQQIQQRSIPFAPFRLECPKVHGVLRLTIELTNSAGGSRRDIIFTDTCHHMDSFYPVPLQLLPFEHEHCGWTPPLENFGHTRINGTCPVDQYFAGVSRIAPKTIAILCCRLRTRKYGDCASLEFPTVTPINPVVDFYDGRGALVSIVPAGPGQLKATFCTLVVKDQETIMREFHQAEEDARTTSPTVPQTTVPRTIQRTEPATTAIFTPQTRSPSVVTTKTTRTPPPPTPPPGHDLIRETLPSNPRPRNFTTQSRPLVSESIDSFPEHLNGQQPWRPIILSESEAERELDGELSLGLPPPPPPIRPPRPPRRKGQQQPPPPQRGSRRRQGQRRRGPRPQRPTPPPDDLVHNDPEHELHTNSDIAAALRSRIQPNKDLLGEPPVKNSVNLQVAPPQGPVTEATTPPPPTTQQTVKLSKGTLEKLIEPSTKTPTTKPSSKASTEPLTGTTVQMSKETAELVAGNGIFQFILGTRAPKSPERKNKGKSQPKSELRFINTPSESTITATEPSTNKPTASFDFDTDVDFDVIPPKTESDRSQALIIFEHSLKDKSIFGKPMKLRRWPMGFSEPEEKKTTFTTSITSTEVPEVITTQLPTTVTEAATTTLKPTARPAPARRRPNPNPWRRTRPEGQVLRFCSKDIAVLDSSDMIIACGLSSQVWDPPHCPSSATCMEAHDASFMICCPVFHG